MAKSSAQLRRSVAAEKMALGTKTNLLCKHQQDCQQPLPGFLVMMNDILRKASCINPAQKQTLGEQVDNALPGEPC